MPRRRVAPREWWLWIYESVSGHDAGYVYYSRKAAEGIHGERDQAQIVHVREVRATPAKKRNPFPTTPCAPGSREDEARARSRVFETAKKGRSKR